MREQVVPPVLLVEPDERVRTGGVVVGGAKRDRGAQARYGLARTMLQSDS